ncbi:ROK family protein [Prodigiosinella confusarubida]|nr:ROK family protein [Serratia sp. ATCC 39006]
MSERKEEKIIVFDIGGTYLRCGQWQNDGTITDIVREPSPSFITYPDDSICSLKNRLLEAILSKLPRSSGNRVGISLGAAMNHHSGVVYGAAPLWGACEVNFRLLDELHAARPDVLWLLMNDVTAMAIHFASQPVCQSPRKVMLITVSSGIACRTFTTQPFKIDFDVAGLQGEIGHLPFLDASLPLMCDCGEVGHLAAYSSGRGIQRVYERLYEEEYHYPPAVIEHFEENFKAALNAGDIFALRVLSTAMRPLADLISTALTLEPTIDVVGLSGGIIDNLPQFVRSVLLKRMMSSGPYLTTRLSPAWLAQHIHICPPDTANGLWGAGLAASQFNENSWMKNNIPHKG